MKKLTLTDDEMEALDDILNWFIANYPHTGRRNTYAHIIQYHIRSQKGKQNENDKEGKEEP